eukprot:TRINITY_DN4533_c0_g2_i4.p1 TRINITY_DN4533_c0_g2~~TRINITY_DN4533_c0_g2_i4.p1  ORF type:complete len:380 (+),score=74.33 TRINITY_DN4533_c0_g2_i4:292-1431(+)
MGAKGVKKALRPIARQVDVYRDFADQRIAVDSAIVLYRLAYVYRSQLARGDLQVVVDAFRRRMQRLTSGGVALVNIFDGGLLSGKAAEHQRRHERKCRAVAKAVGLGDEEALLKAQISVSEELVLAVQQMLVTEGLVFLVAPYEADAQLAWEIHGGRVDAILTEDSDLLVHGCERVLMEFNGSDGSAVLYDMSTVASAWRSGRDHQLCDFLEQHGKEVLPRYAMLNQCDYGGMPGVGPVTACKLLAGHGVDDTALKQALQQFWQKRGLSAPDIEQHLRLYDQGLDIWQCQIVYCADTHSQRPLNGSMVDVASKPWVGSVELDPERVQQLVTGQLNPRTGAACAMPPLQCALRPGTVIQTRGHLNGNIPNPIIHLVPCVL